MAYAREPISVVQRLLLYVLLLMLSTACFAQDSQRSDVIVSTTPNGSRLELPVGVPAIEVPSGEVRLHRSGETLRLRAEIAETPLQRHRGLMYRHSMPENAGMLFVFQSEQLGGFWMYNTYIPLSIAYINAQGIIVTLRDMEPCGGRSQQECSAEAVNYLPSAPYRYALEVNQSFFETHGISVGDRASFVRF